jgi:hypothetical protein
MASRGKHTQTVQHSSIRDRIDISSVMAMPQTPLKRLESSNVLFAALGITAGVLVGIAETTGAKLGVAAGVAALIAILAVRRPVNVAVLAIIGMYFVQRVGGASLAAGSGGGVSYSDALLAAASVIALPAVIGSPELRRLRLALFGVGAYLSCLLPTVFLNPSKRAYFEWTHRLVLIGGALIVGAWIVREGYERTTLRWFTGVTIMLSLLAVENWFVHGFHPASPLGLNKNFIGAQLATALILIVVARRRLGLPRMLWIAAVVLVSAALLASQSRGAELGAALGLLVGFVLSPGSHGRGWRLVSAAVAIALAWFAFTSISAELRLERSNLDNSSIGVRVNVEKATRDLWRTSPVDGVGLKYFMTGNYGYYAQAANNVVDNELAESGVFGVAGFVALQGAAALAGWRRRRNGPLVVAGLAMTVGLLLHGMIDIYWTAGTVPLPFLILGMALAEREPQASSRPDDRPSERLPRTRPPRGGHGKMIPSTRSRTRVHSYGSAASAAAMPTESRVERARSSASASAVGSRGSASRKPLTPSTIAADAPASDEATTGSPEAIASMITSPNGSYVVGSAKTSAAA